jgi:hypothetical protein
MNISGLVPMLSFNVETGSAAYFGWFSLLSLLMLTFRTASAQALALLVLFFR